MATELRAQATPFDTLVQISSGYWLSRCLHVVADRGVADALDDTPRTAADLAEATGTHAEALARVLRLLSAHGVFESRGGGFGHTSRLLRADHPQSMRSLVRMHGLPIVGLLREAGLLNTDGAAGRE